ncbi:MAG: hypothetical protein C4320_03965 [Armatimonadota bacterium]
MGMSPRLEFAIGAAFRAGRSTLPLFETGTPVEHKGDDSPITAADRGSERILRAEIERHFPGEAILGEEQGLSGAGDDRWIVDPLDGTKSFIAGVPLYSTLVAYERAGTPILGVAYFPAIETMVYAESGGGAFWNGRPMQVRSVTRLEGEAIACGGHRSLIARNRWEGFAALIGLAMTTRTWGDAYGHVLVASGRIAAMVDPIVSRWDISAIIPIIQEAGGSATDFAGGDPLIGESNLELISCAPGVREELLATFRS